MLRRLSPDEDRAYHVPSRRYGRVVGLAQLLDPGRDVGDALEASAESPLPHPVAEWSGVSHEAVAEEVVEDGQPSSFESLSRRLERSLRSGPGIAVLKCRPGAAPDHARLMQLLVNRMLGANVTRMPGDGDRPLFSISVAKDATAGGLYSGTGLKSRAIGLHTDGSGTGDREVEILSMLCVRPARFGGQSRVASSAAALDRLSVDVGARLQCDFARKDPYRPALAPSALKRAPIYERSASRAWLRFSYHPERVRDGTCALEGVLSDESAEALRLLDEALEAGACDVNLAANEILFVNNLVIAHDRRAFRDDPAAPRLLERCWTGTMIP